MRAIQKKKFSFVTFYSGNSFILSRDLVSPFTNSIKVTQKNCKMPTNLTLSKSKSTYQIAHIKKHISKSIYLKTHRKAYI